MTFAILNAISAPSSAPTASQAPITYGFARASRPASAFQLPALGTKGSISLASLTGKPIVINFWASSCAICKSETPALASVARSTRGRVSFLGIDTADVRSAATAFVDHYHVPYPMAFDPSETIGARYDIPGLPVTVFLSPSGKTILGENVGALTPHSLDTILRRLYGSV